MSSVLPKDIIRLIIREYICDVFSPNFDLFTAVQCLAVSRFVRSCVTDHIDRLSLLQRRQCWDVKKKILWALIHRDSILRHWMRRNLCSVEGVDVPEYFMHYFNEFGMCTICGKVLPIAILSKHQRRCLDTPSTKRYDRCDKCYATHPFVCGTPHAQSHCPMRTKKCFRAPRCDFEGPSTIVDWHIDNDCSLKLSRCTGICTNGTRCNKRFRKTTSSQTLCSAHRG